MRKTVVALGLVLAGSNAALAGPCPVSPGDPTYALDENSFGAAFDFFAATFGNSASCDFSFVARPTTPEPDVFAVYTANYRFGSFEEDTARFTVDRNRRSLVVTQTFDASGTLTVDDIVGKEADGTIKSTITMDVLTDVSSGGSTVTLDSADYAELATMTRTDAEESLVDLGLAQASLVTHLDATSGLLTGGNMTFEGDNEVRVLGGVGSYMLGGNVRYNVSDGFTLLAGVSLIDQSAGGASYSGVLGAAALRFVEPSGASQRVFGEAGVSAGALRMSFTRSYTDSDGVHTVSGTGDGGLGALYVKGGVLFALDDHNEISLSATAKQTLLGFGNYSEAMSLGNLFAGDLYGQFAGFTTLKVGADWTVALASDVDLTAHAGVGTTFANQATTAYITGGGTTSGTMASTLFAEYGLGLGWHVTRETTVEGFLQGSTGTGIGSHVQIGAAARMIF